MDAAMIQKINDENVRAMALFARLLSRDEPLFSEEEIVDFSRDCGLSAHEGFSLLIAAACGMEENRAFLNHYLSPALRPLSFSAYRQNPYLQTVRFPEKTLGTWQFSTLSYTPYQLLPCGHTRLTDQGREVPAIGYFDRVFSYPAVLENGREWMTVTPNEIETMAAPLNAARGRIAVFGLGLGYFAFMAAQKASVSSVTVIERDQEVIHLFRRHLLPQFPHAEKIRVVPCDAFDYLGGPMKAENFDFAFIDLWHDVGDGLPMYLRCRGMEKNAPGCAFHYWIEQDLLIFLRGLLMEDDLSAASLSLSALRDAASRLTIKPSNAASQSDNTR